MNVDRYLVTSDLVVQHEQGMWVRYSDIAAALTAERAKFAAENERLRKVLDRIAYGPFGGPEASASDLLDSITDFAREALTTKQAAEDAAGGKK
jgi:hypothetical protein